MAGRVPKASHPKGTLRFPGPMPPVEKSATDGAAGSIRKPVMMPS